MEQLPPELVDKILGYLSDRDYFSARQSGRLFWVTGQKEHRRRRYMTADPRALALAGELEGVALHLGRYKQSLLDEIIRAGNLPCVRLIMEKSALRPSTYALDWACFEGHLHMVRYLVGQGYRGTTCAFDWAASNGHVSTVRYLHAVGISGTGRGVDLGARFGPLELIRFFYFAGLDFSQRGIRGVCSRRDNDVTIPRLLISLQIPLIEGLDRACEEGGELMEYVLRTSLEKPTKSMLVDWLTTAKSWNNWYAVDVLFQFIRHHYPLLQD